MLRTFGKYALILLLLLVGCTADFHSKQWAKNEMKGKPPMAAINEFMDLGYSENRGMVFGILNNDRGDFSRTFLLVVRIVLIVAVAAFVVIKRRGTFWFLLPFVCILAGGGNIADQLRAGYVIDFIHIHLGRLFDWPFYFNLADVFLCTGIGLLLTQYTVGRRTSAVVAGS